MAKNNTWAALLTTLLCASWSMAAQSPAPAGQAIPATRGAQIEAELVAKYGQAQQARLHRGIAQVAALWRGEDGNVDVFSGFVRDNFIADPKALDALFNRYQHNLEVVFGHSQEIHRELNTPSDLDTGPIAPYDEVFAAWDTSAHVLDDMFENKLAFVALLNFPLTSLDERTRQGATWTRRQWADTFLAERFRQRLPADANQAVAEAYAASDRYIARYNIWMHHLVDDKGGRLFPAGKRLLSHWNLRDELKANYADKQSGLAKQRAIQKVMERIVTQEIPAVVIDNPLVDWNPFTNTVARSSVNDVPAGAPAPAPLPAGAVNAAREPDLRYATWLANFHAMQVVDKYSPSQPTYIQRIFENDRQLSEARVQGMLEQVLGSPQVKAVAAQIEKRLGRKLEPFDIWYSGFRPGAGRNEADLDVLVSKRFPTAEAYQREIPTLLRSLGFTPERADYVARHIVVDPARGSGHAMGAQMRGEPAHLRTRVERDGMNYKGYNIAVHEMCHNVEQTFSLNDIDYYALHGVPNTAFTEALAFTCQDRDLELLGLSKPDAKSRALQTLETFWSTFEMSGVSLVDMQAWRWMYAHPNARPAEMREAVLNIAREVWNKWYAPVFGVRDVTLLAIYSHMINNMMYLPDYPIGFMIAFQVEAQMDKSGDFGKEFERVARIGSIAPDLWMTQATGRPVGPEALLEAAGKALTQL
ncbi:MAG TPA: hypothetical protein VN645_09300 [Steroidobacteraceae bacterium]|nr:hypothetical protein [Steroidobacteraceae bacterium]